MVVGCKPGRKGRSGSWVSGRLGASGGHVGRTSSLVAGKRLPSVGRIRRQLSHRVKPELCFEAIPPQAQAPNDVYRIESVRIDAGEKRKPKKATGNQQYNKLKSNDARTHNT